MDVAVKGNSIVVGGTVQLGMHLCCLPGGIDPLRCNILKPQRHPLTINGSLFDLHRCTFFLSPSVFIAELAYSQRAWAPLALSRVCGPSGWIIRSRIIQNMSLLVDGFGKSQI